MTTTGELDYSGTANSNTDIGGVSVAEGIPAANLNDAIRSMAAFRHDAITRHVAKAAGTYTAVKADHNQFWRFAGIGTVNLTAAVTLGSGWSLKVSAVSGSVIIDPAGSELINGSASMTLGTGTMAEIICTGTAFYPVIKAISGDGDVVLDGSMTAAAVTSTGAIVGQSTLEIAGRTVLSDYTRFGQNTTDVPGLANSVEGASFHWNSKRIYVSASNYPLYLNETTSDATSQGLLNLLSEGVQVGSITTLNGAVSYNPFFASHWSQLSGMAQPDIPLGTICESIDEMTGINEKVAERLPCFKVSDAAGSSGVYGVFHGWSNDGEDPGKALIGALGAYFIRIAAHETVNRGDLIESDGNGCGRVQADDVMRSSTVGKVSSTMVIETYSDGSYIVPCTLHCG